MASRGNQHCASCIGTLSFPIDTARIVCEEGLSNGRVSVRLCPSVLFPRHAAAVGLLLSARRAGDVDRLLPGAQHQQRRSTARSSKCGQ